MRGDIARLGGTSYHEGMSKPFKVVRAALEKGAGEGDEVGVDPTLLWEPGVVPIVVES